VTTTARNARTSTGRVRLGAGVLAVAVGATLAACGSSSSGGGTNTSGGDTGGSKGPVTIGYVFNIKGESAVDIDDYNNGANLAVEQLNAAGGLLGQPVKTFREPLPPLDLQATNSNFLAAVGKKPTAMVGVPAPNQATALATAITRAKIPVLITDVGDPFDIIGSAGGSEYGWYLGNYDPDISKSLADFGVNTLGIKRMAILAGNDTYGMGGSDGAKAALKDVGQTPSTVQSFSETATDLTSQVLALKNSNADGVFSWSYPNTVAVQMKQMTQNGINIPVLAGTSAEIAVNSGGVPKELLGKLSIAVPCNAKDASYSSSVAEFAKAYEAKYKSPASINAGWAYDGVMTIARAVKLANSNDPQKVNDAISQVAETSGACGVLKADDAHVLNHQLVIATYNADGTNKSVKVLKLDPKPALKK
jgi:branched-chain amino acid transport system substrate-binding protein